MNSTPTAILNQTQSSAQTATQAITPTAAQTPVQSAPSTPASEKEKPKKAPKTPPKNPVGRFFFLFWQAIKRNSIPTAIMAALWMLLWWLRSFGLQWAFLWPLHFLTGALNGYTGNRLGGTIGKTILLILFNSMVNSIFRGFLANTGGRKKRTDDFKSQLKSDVKSNTKSTLLKKIPYYSTLKSILGTRTPQALGWNALGIGGALFLYPFITGDGALVNSMVCLAISSSLGKQILTQRGLLITLLNRLLAKKHLSKINRGHVDRVITGFTFGMTLAVPIAALVYIPKSGPLLWRICAQILPWILIVLGVMGILWKLFGPILGVLGSLLKKLFKKIAEKRATKKAAKKAAKQAEKAAVKAAQAAEKSAAKAAKKQ